MFHGDYDSLKQRIHDLQEDYKRYQTGQSFLNAKKRKWGSFLKKLLRGTGGTREKMLSSKEKKIPSMMGK